MGDVRYVTRPLTPEARLRLKGVVLEGSPFSASWSSTLNLLDKEMRCLTAADEFIMQIDVEERMLKLDGGVRADARPASGAVAISVETPDRGTLLFVCGKFSKWQDNVRAIALGMEALRRVERYGIVQSDEQYRGFRALGSGVPMPAAKMTVEEASRFLADHSFPNLPLRRLSEEQVLTAFRHAAKTLHPDAGGDAEKFKRLVEAKEVLLADG